MHRADTMRGGWWRWMCPLLLPLTPSVAIAATADGGATPFARYEAGLLMMTAVGIFVFGGLTLRVIARFRPIRPLVWLLPVLIVISAVVWAVLEAAGSERLANLRALVGFLLAFFVFLSLLYPLSRLMLPSRALQTRAGVPTLLRGLAVGIVGFVGMFVLLSWSFPRLTFTPVFVTSGVVSLVIGLALQDVLGNLMSGVVLSVERPFTVGDWVHIGDTEGEVVELTWRATKVRTRENDHVLIPNNSTGRQNVTNYARPTADHLLTVNVGVSYETPCGLVVKALLEAAHDVEEVLKHPAPDVYFVEFGDSSLVYQLRVWIDNYESIHAIASEARKQIWYTFKRRGITIPFPQRDVNLRQAAEAPSHTAARLVATGGPLRGAMFPLEAGPMVIGRHPDCDIAVVDPHVSARHAVVEPHGAGYRLRDLGSRHGTRLNGALIESAQLEQGDRIDIEPVTLVFEQAVVPATVLTARRSKPAAWVVEGAGEPPAETPETCAPDRDDKA